MISTLLALSLLASETPRQEEVPFVVSDSPVVTVPAGEAYTFGWLEVPENRARDDSRNIRLPVYIFHSRSEEPALDPIVYTAGGPGSSSFGSVPYMQYWSYLDERDVILFEQRGTRYAEPHLDCPEWDEAAFRALDPTLTPADSQALLKEAAKGCRDRLRSEGVDLNGYTTAESAQDLVDLRRALGIERWNLLTGSYSTQIAQVLMRLDAEAIRSVVMDSPMPLDRRYDEESNRGLMEALTRVLNDGEAAYPGLRERFFGQMVAYNKEPLELEVADPWRPEVDRLALHGRDIVALLSLGGPGPSPDLASDLEAILGGDTSSLVEAVGRLGPRDSSAMGMRLSVWCADESPFASSEVVEAERERHAPIRGMSPALFGPEICTCWGVAPADPQDRAPVKSDIPTLILSGSYDPFTPQSWGEYLARSLDGAHHLVFQGWGHAPTSYWDEPCAMALAVDFFRDPTVAPSADCLPD